MFSEDHIEKLASTLQYARDNQILTCRTTGLPVDDRFEDLDYARKHVTGCQRWEEKRMLVNCISHIRLSGTNCEADGDFPCTDQSKHYTGEWCFQDGDPDDRFANWGGQRVTFSIKKYYEGGSSAENNYEGWAIVRRWQRPGFEPELDEDGEVIPGEDDGMIEKLCWIAPYSYNQNLPPFDGWVPADPLAKGNPTIKYMLNESLSRIRWGLFDR